MAKQRRRRKRRRPPAEHSEPALPKRAEPAPRAAARRPAAAEERPPAPWGSFPLAELAVLAGLVIIVLGFVWSDPLTLFVGLVLGSLAGLELSVREHFGGYRSHTTLLAGAAAVLTVGLLFYVAGLVMVVCLIAGAAVFAAAALALRAAFRRASGGLSVRIGGLRG